MNSSSNKLFVVIISLLIVVSCQNGSLMAADDLHDQTLLTDVEWSLIQINQQPAQKGEGDKPPTLKLSYMDKKVVGFAGCNNYFGQFSLSNEQLSFSPLGMTRRFCQNSADLEHAFTQVLSQVDSFEVTTQHLKLFDKEKAIIAEFSQKSLK